MLIELAVTAVVVAARPTPAAAEDVTAKLSAIIVAQHPIGVPVANVKDALWPLLSRELRYRLDVAKLCEADYFRQRPDRDEKPEFAWLETGLFSGGNERALPTQFKITRTERLGRSRSRVMVRFTYADTVDTYCCRPPDPANTFDWYVAFVVQEEEGRAVIDDRIEYDRDHDTWKVLSTLSHEFDECDGPRWVGDRRRPSTNGRRDQRRRPVVR